MSGRREPEAVTKSIVVRRNAPHVFRLWTEQIDAWWPTGHSMSRDPDTRVVLECKPGGRFYERTPDGDEYYWGEVERWEPPHHLTLAWYMGSGQEKPSRVAMQFVPLADGATRVEVVHRGPELLGGLWESRQEIFSGSWERILSALSRYAGHTKRDEAE
ncbi:MAG: SRPBCC domain-containing protein [Rubrobacteraceae bacterium]